MARIGDIVIYSEHPASLARFWAVVLDGYAVRPYDDAELARLGGLGFTPETDPSVAVDGPGPTLFFQKDDGKKTGKNRLHFDLVGGERMREIARLVELGATVRENREIDTGMLDPEGNEFCIRDPD